jgi:hypothetical protein
MKMLGMNMYGVYEKSPLDYTSKEYDEIQRKLSSKKRKSKRKINMEKVGESLFIAPPHNENMGMDIW